MKTIFRNGIAKLALGIATLTAGALIAAPASATAITSVTTLSTGGLTFSNFTCDISRGGIGATPSHCKSIDVNTNGALPGLNFVSDFDAGLFGFDIASLTYKVSSATAITAISLAFDGSFGGLGVSYVKETVRTAAGAIVGQLTVSCSLIGCDYKDPGFGWFDIPLQGIHTDLFVTKEIGVDSNVLGSANIGTVSQGFKVAQVPEPGSLALIGLGLLAGGVAKRRRARKAGLAA